tara:strand:+ start:233 stop:664 length:432 start_codon:yes stop_codon:yes gene_type:complete
LQKEGAHIENQERNLILKGSKIYKLPVKSLSEYDNLTQKEKIIFLAGVFDGEGCFGIWSKIKKQRYLACSVETTDRDMVKRFHDMYGGAFYLVNKRQAHHKDSWRWKIWGKGALKSLQEMISYMCKRRQEKFKNVVERIKISN